jgi:hypothetical protein
MTIGMRRVSKNAKRFRVIFLGRSPDKSCETALESVGIKADESAPSANSFRKLLGRLNTPFTTSEGPLSPNTAPITNILTKPRILETNVQIITPMVVRELLRTLFSFMIVLTLNYKLQTEEFFSLFTPQDKCPLTRNGSKPHQGIGNLSFYPNILGKHHFISLYCLHG